MRLLLLLALAACQTPAILEPTKDRAGCNPDTEHDCARGGCCLLGFTCGGEQPDLFVTCANNECCDEQDGVGAKKGRRSVKKRIPSL